MIALVPKSGSCVAPVRLLKAKAKEALEASKAEEPQGEKPSKAEASGSKDRAPSTRDNEQRWPPHCPPLPLAHGHPA